VFSLDAEVCVCSSRTVSARARQLRPPLELEVPEKRRSLGSRVSFLPRAGCAPRLVRRLLTMVAQSPADDKNERKKRRQAGVKELNRAAKNLEETCPMSGVVACTGKNLAPAAWEGGKRGSFQKDFWRGVFDGLLLCGKNTRRAKASWQHRNEGWGHRIETRGSAPLWEARPRLDAVCAKSFLKSWRRWVRLCPLPFLSRQIDCGLTRRDAFCLCFGLNVWAEGVCVGLA
jgi:hypothetical protein